MSGRRLSGKTYVQLEAEILALTQEVATLRHPLTGSVTDNQRRMTETLHNLQVHQEGLRAQNEELRKSRDDVEKIGNRYRDLFEYSPVGFFIIDENFTVVDANIAGMGMLGRTKPIGPVALSEVVADAIANLTVTIADADGRVEVMGVLPVVKGDAPDLIRLFQNLIGNAIKYSQPDHPPVVIISTETRPMSNVISVCDNGIGISPDYFGTIFGVFKRLHTPDQYDGNGIGLAICKKVVDQHNGRIWVESQPGEGTVFFIEFPRGA